ncbi:MAG: PASTA domain-containing protein, partial [Thermoleophilia bacterium]
RVPFEGENPVAIALKHLSDVPVPPQALVPALPDNLNNVVLRALAKDPAERYPNAREFLADLERCRRNMAVATAPVDDGATRVIPAVGALADTGQTTARPAAVPLRTPPPKRSNKGKIFLIVLLASLALAAVALGVYFLAFQGTAVAVPDVVGQPRQQAEDTLRAAGFKVETKAEEYNETIAAGSVVRQDPEAGEKLREGGTVRLVISRGSGKVTVPDLVGQTADYAESKLKELELKGDRQPDQSSDTVPAGSIISQDPPAGSEAQKGSQVKYIVSKGAEPPGDAQVPDLQGMTQSEAQNALNAEKLVLGSVSEDYSDSVPAGRVMSQSPAAGQTIPEGSTVNITLSLGSEPSATVPDVMGDTQGVAEAAITAEGLVPAVVYTVDPLNNGKVVGQNPAAFATAAPGSTVTITVATLP